MQHRFVQDALILMASPTRTSMYEQEPTAGLEPAGGYIQGMSDK